MGKLSKLPKYIDRHGVWGTFREMYLRIMDKFLEKYYNVKTKPSKFDFNAETQNVDSHYYDTFHYASIFHLLKYVPDPYKDYTLIDFGCGKGRVIIAAARYEFRKLIGVEYSSLVGYAKTNINRMRFRKTRDIEFFNGDARDYVIPEDVNVIFFNNPFKGTILDKVIQNIYESIRSYPRKIIIIYVNYPHFDELIRDKNWIKLKVRGKLAQEVSYSIYEADPEKVSGSFYPESKYIENSQY